MSHTALANHWCGPSERGMIWATGASPGRWTAPQQLGQVLQLGDLGGVLQWPPHHPGCPESRKGSEEL